MALQFQPTGGVPTPVFFPHNPAPVLQPLSPGAIRMQPGTGFIRPFPRLGPSPPPGPHPGQVAMAGAAHQMIAAHVQRQAAARAALQSHPRFF